MKKLLLVAVVLMLGAAAFAQAVNPASAATTLNLTKQASLAISVTTAPGALTLTGSAADTAITTMVVNSTWNLGVARLNKNVQVCATVAPLAGTGTNTDTVPTTAIYVDSAATPLQTVSAGGGCGNSSVLIATHALTDPTDLHNNGGTPDTAYIQVKGMANLTPDTYSGAVTVYAFVTP